MKYLNASNEGENPLNGVVRMSLCSLIELNSKELTFEIKNKSNYLLDLLQDLGSSLEISNDEKILMKIYAPYVLEMIDSLRIEFGTNEVYTKNKETLFVLKKEFINYTY